MIVPDLKDRNRDVAKANGKSSLSRTLHKWAAAFKRITHETLNNMDDTNNGDDRINVLFHTEPSIKKVSSLDRDSGASMSPVCPNSLSEMRLTTETEDSLTENSVQNNGSSPSEADEDDDTDEDDGIASYRKFDSVKECVKLRQEVGEPFCKGNEIWERRRALWVQPTASKDSYAADCRRHREIYSSIPQAYHTRIYKKLVMDDKPLREPMNLQDALQIINAGWVETKKWENAAKGLA